ncbi:MAG: Adaptive-response sensory-kinase SasA [Candidatus Scalindua arabica]|uniref:histidine kinase n=1 Tax=Candidatus Scalindua arabica TaxID=1127984 RepID=A0A942A1A2_9BACT|nr:Adaptive-response sensory-kinase SasA [Candidatus Scalindua arabica]
MKNKDQSKRWFSIFHPETFHLMLYYSITSFIVIGIVSFLVGEIFSRMEKNDLIERSEKYAGYIVTNINHAMYKDFFTPTINEYGYIDLENNRDQFNRLDKVIKSNIYGLNLKKVYIFNMNGQIIYSNITEHVGYVLERGRNMQLDSAIKGDSASTLQHSGMMDSKGVQVEESLLESYYPVYEYSEGEFNTEKQVGVLEIYQDMKDLDYQISMAHRKAVIITSSSMGLLFLILLLIIKKASGVIHLKTNQLVEAKDNLEEKVDERTREIKQAYERLQETQKRLSRSEKLAGIGTLAAGVAHEINNPLASVASCAEGLINRMDNVDFKSKDDGNVFPDYLKTICDETYRCKTIISKLLDFSRRQVPVFGKVDINDLLSEVVKLVGRQKELNNLNIELDYSSEAIIIYGDFNQLKQVFLNMILNAIDATEGGGQIKISTGRSSDEAQIKFEDSGCGIASENLDKVFEPFFSTKLPGKGTGLGISICYGIIEEHKGKILVSSDGVGKGAIFTIILPVDAKERRDGAL